MPNHPVHAIATLFLCGLWAPVWLAASMRTGPWRCAECGGVDLGKSAGEFTPKSVRIEKSFAYKLGRWMRGSE